MSRSVPESFNPSLVASRRILASTGSVVLVGTAAATAVNPSWSCSLVMVNFMGFPGLPEILLFQPINTLVVAVEERDMWTDPVTHTFASCCVIRLAWSHRGARGRCRHFPTGITTRQRRPRCRHAHCVLHCQQLCPGRFYALPELTIAAKLRLDLVDAMDHRGMIAAPKRLADF